jgi:doxX family protein
MGTPYTIVRQTSIAASAARIFPCIEDFRAWRAWSPWRQLDPGIQEEYSDPSFGVGARYKWSGNRKAGAGSMALTHSDPPRKIEIDLVFVKPFPNRSRIEFILDEKRGETSVEWRLHGEFSGAMRFFRLFFNMDKAVGRDLERGLERLRQAVESD